MAHAIALLAFTAACADGGSWTPPGATETPWDGPAADATTDSGLPMPEKDSSTGFPNDAAARADTGTVPPRDSGTDSSDTPADTGVGPTGSAPAHDTCSSATVLTGASGSRSDPLSGAHPESEGCSTAPDVFYQIEVADRAVLYAHTFGTAFETHIALRQPGCSGGAVACVGPACGTAQSQLVALVEPGTHIISVHGVPRAPTDLLHLEWEVVKAASGTNTEVLSPGRHRGNTSGTSAKTASCGGGAAAPEDAYYWTACPGETRSIFASTCSLGTTFDTVVHMGGSGLDICADDDTTCLVGILQTTLSTSTMGPGVFVLAVDGFRSEDQGAYELSLSW